MPTTRANRRPKKIAPPVRTARLEARITPDQKALIERAAAYEGRSLTDFVVHTLATAAQTVVQNHEVIRLTAKESRALIEALQDAPGPNAALRKAVRQHRRSVESR